MIWDTQMYSLYLVCGRDILVLLTTYKFLSNSLLSHLTVYLAKLLGISPVGFDIIISYLLDILQSSNTGKEVREQ
jgi:hypothetical protein